MVLLHNNLLFIQWTTKILISLKLLKNLGTSVPEIFGILPKFSKTQNFWVCPYATVQNSQVWLLITQEKGITLLASFGRCQCFNHPSYKTIVTRFNRLGACCQRWPWIRRAGVDSDRILRFSYGSGPGVKVLWKTGSVPGVTFQFRQ